MQKIKDNNKKEGEKFWDQNPCGGEWLSFKKKREWYLKTEPYMIDLAREDLLRDKEILDVGCGQGLIISLLAERARHAVGLDASQTSLERAGKGIQEMGLNNVEFVKGDAEKLPFENDIFDTVYSIGVLHHTNNTQKGIDEVYRVLKNGGTAVIMLYRKSCPKGIMVNLLRSLSKFTDRIKGKNFYIANRLREKYRENPTSPQGTALLELFGCPILKTFSKKEIKKMFNRFNEVKISCVQPGFKRLADFMPLGKNKLMEKIFFWLDEKTKSPFGFYIIIEAEK